MAVISTVLLTRLDARDRALFMRWVIAEHGSTGARQLWRALTHLGGPSATIALCTVPVFLGGTIAHAATHGFAILALSHLVVQIVKRSVGRPRPSCRDLSHTLIVAPDRFSFPSGHAAAAMAVALAYATAFPAFALPLLLLAVVVGVSRVCLGVHYPGDVIMGQLIAIAAGAAILSV